MKIEVSKDMRNIKGFLDGVEFHEIELWKNDSGEWVVIHCANIKDYETGMEQLALYNAVFAKAYSIE